MPSTIRETLSERIRALPQLRQFLADFAVATGVPVHFVSALGNRSLGPETCTLCRFLHAHPEGARHCGAFLQKLLEQSLEKPTSAGCDAGLQETAVPLRTGGQTFGYLVFGHSRLQPPDRAALNRARHLLSRVGVSIPAEQLEAVSADTPVVDATRVAAMMRLVETAAERLVLEITQHIVHPPATLPPLVEQVCRLVRAEHAQELALPEFARRLGVSPGHLSRIFHHNTGMRFVEYVARVRAERAKALLLETEVPVTEIAFACGFQSLSQFNRTMRAHFGCQPRQLRRKNGLGRGAASDSRA
ncbi:MAG TPA: helix-turn-helix domain-containing protein [Opitutaceae bacterium]|nr:helix-turn-helix domain-containing protein [Opitutaceae bacterium]